VPSMASRARCRPGDGDRGGEVDEEDDVVVAHVRPRRHTKRRCGICGQRAPAMTAAKDTTMRALDSARCAAFSSPTPRG